MPQLFKIISKTCAALISKLCNPFAFFIFVQVELRCVTCSNTVSTLHDFETFKLHGHNNMGSQKTLNAFEIVLEILKDSANVWSNKPQVSELLFGPLPRIIYPQTAIS